MNRVLVFLLLMVFPVAGMAATIHVPGDQPTIQAGIDAAVDGDTVLVADGTYTGDGNYLIDFNGKALTVRSENGAENCIVDCEGEGRGFKFHSGEGEDSVLQGFTIRGAIASWGGGINCTNISSPVITDNIITGNSVTQDGAGISCGNYSSPVISNNTITGNSAGSFGGGISCGYSSPVISDNSITNNTAIVRGGGIFCSGPAFPQISNNSITGNSAYYGGGIYCWENSSPLISNNTIANNTASGAAGGGICTYLCDPVIINNSVDRNTADYAGGICVWGEGGGSPGMITGNIVSDNITATEGGGIYLTETTVPVLNNIITGNSAVYWGGGLYCLGEAGVQAPTVTNNIFIGNSADEGGGAISCNFYDSMTLSNNTITGNSSITYGGGIECGRCSLVIINTILWNNTAPTGPEIWVGDNVQPSTLTISYSDVAGGMGSVYVTPGDTLNWGTGMIEEDPVFVTGPDGDYYLSQDPCQPGVVNLCVDGGNPFSPMIVGTTRTDCHPDVGVIDMGYHYALLDTVTADLGCVPDAGVLPFAAQFSVTLGNDVEHYRTVAGRINVTLAGGATYQSWRAGYTNLGPNETFVTAWMQALPALGSLVGSNVFTLHVEDVTPPPYNQPPYPPSGDIDTATCTVVGEALTK